MGEALITRRGGGGGAKVADGFPKTMSGTTLTISDLIGCSGFAIFSLGGGSIGGNGTGHTISIFYDGATVSCCSVKSTSTSTNITATNYTGSFDPSTGKITLNVGIVNNNTVQCIYW